MTSIGDWAFSECSSLTSVTIPESVTSIGVRAFQFCTSLTSVTLPNSVETIGGLAFLESGLTSVTLPDHLTSIGRWVFSGCSELTTVTIPDGVTSIGSETFSFCTSLSSVTIGNGVTSIAQETFYECTSLVSVTIPDSVTSIGHDAFSYCTALTSVRIGNNVTSIGGSAFFKCTSLKSVTIPESVTNIEDKAFGYYYGEDYNFYVVDGFTIYGYKGTAAQTYAEENGFAFISLGQAVPQNPFSDVDSSAYYSEAVLWAVNHEPVITNGTGNGKFSPDMTCTRGQIVTFLWRAKGCPEPEALNPDRRDGNLPSAGEQCSPLQGRSDETVADASPVQTPFDDIKADDYYFKAVLWAVENNITQGTGNGKFSPNMGCTRGQVVTFLWRTEGCPEPAADGSPVQNPFTDVNENEYYYKAVLWAVENNITQGTGNGKFSPKMTCTRGQIVTFLCRAFAA